MIYVKQNDRQPAASTTLLRGATVVDLTSAVGVTFRMRADGQPQNAPKVEAAATVVDAAAGQVAYEWADGDTDTPGLYYAEWTVDWGSGVEETFPTIFSDPVLVEGRVAV